MSAWKSEQAVLHLGDDVLLLIGCDTTGAGANVFLKLQDENHEPPVVEILDLQATERTEIQPLYDSLPQLLFHQAFLCVRLPSFTHQAILTPVAWLAWDSDLVGTRSAFLRQTLLRDGFTPIPFSSVRAGGDEQEGLVVSSSQAGKEGITVQAAASAPKHLATFIERISQLLSIARVT